MERFRLSPGGDKKNQNITALSKICSIFVKILILFSMPNEDKAIFKPDRRNGREYRNMLAAARNGKFIKLRNGLYARPDVVTDDMVDIDAIVPKGILCLYSAWYYHGLSTQVPDAFYVAVERTRKVRLPDFPNIRLVFQIGSILDIGVMGIREKEFDMLITDPERSVCDAVKYRNKIGIDVMTEIINNYLRRSDRNLSVLTRYAKRLRIYNYLYPLLQVKL